MAENKKERGMPQIVEGVVSSDKMDKTVVVKIETKKKDPQYGKYIKHTTKYVAHDEKNECQNGDRVQIMKTRPMSKNKNWRVKSIVSKSTDIGE